MVAFYINLFKAQKFLLLECFFDQIFLQKESLSIKALKIKLDETLCDFH